MDYTPILTRLSLEHIAQGNEFINPGGDRGFGDLQPVGNFGNGRFA